MDSANRSHRGIRSFETTSPAHQDSEEPELHRHSYRRLGRTDGLLRLVYSMATADRRVVQHRQRYYRLDLGKGREHDQASRAALLILYRTVHLWPCTRHRRDSHGSAFETYRPFEVSAHRRCLWAYSVYGRHGGHQCLFPWNGYRRECACQNNRILQFS